MSTSVTHSGTTTSAGRPGRSIGVAAAALALIIAAGVVFTVNQGSDSVSEQVQSLPGAYTANYPNELDRLNDLGAKVAAESHPAFNIERTKMAMAGQLDSVSGATYVPNITVDEMVPLPANEGQSATNIERIRMQNAGELDVDTTSVVDQRFAHEFLEEQRTPVNGSEGNPLEGIAE